MEECYLWRHRPIVSSPPEELLFHFLNKSENEVFEKALFLLEDGNYLYVRYSGPLDNQLAGITDIEEFATLTEAKEVYDGN